MREDAAMKSERALMSRPNRSKGNLSVHEVHVLVLPRNKNSKESILVRDANYKLVCNLNFPSFQRILIVI